MTIEQKIAKLDELAEQIEQGVSLEKSLEIFDQSVVLADECMKQLSECKGKLIILREKVRKMTDEN